MVTDSSLKYVHGERRRVSAWSLVWQSGMTSDKYSDGSHLGCIPFSAPSDVVIADRRSLALETASAPIHASYRRRSSH